MRSKKFSTPVHFNQWILLADNYSAELANNFLRKLNEVSPPMGIKWDKPRM